jgi:predicted acyltransferase
MGDNHLYHGEGIAFDPEGLLSTLPAIANVIGGYMVGSFVQQKGKTWEGISKLLLAGFSLICIAYFWIFFSQSIKNYGPALLYFIQLALIASFSLPLFTWSIFYTKQNGPNFFEVFGKNPLFIYLLSEILVIIAFMIPVGQTNLFSLDLH